MGRPIPLPPTKPTDLSGRADAEYVVRHNVGNPYFIATYIMHKTQGMSDSDRTAIIADFLLAMLAWALKPDSTEVATPPPAPPPALPPPGLRCPGCGDHPAVFQVYEDGKLYICRACRRGHAVQDMTRVNPTYSFQCLP